MRKLLPWILGITLAIPVAVSSVAPVAVRAQEACPAASPTPAPSAAPLLMPEDARLALFEAVWGSIDGAYLDPTFNGKDWDAIGDQYAPLYLQVEDAWQIYDLTTEMVEQLDDPDVRFVSPLVIENLPPEEQDYVGIGALVNVSTTQETGEPPHILYLFEGSGAADAGLRIRDRILSVEGDPCVSIRRIRGPEGTTVTLEVQSPGEEPREVVVERRRIDPTIRPIAETIGDQGDVGYLRLPSMEGQPLLDGVAEALTGFRDQDLRGLVIDARSVGLGGLGVTVGIVAHLLDGDAGTFYSRAERTDLVLPESELLASFKDLPLVVLLDEDSSGEPERLAAILQSTGRATIVGQPTEGDTRVVQQIPFEDGSVLQVVTIGLELVDGTRLEQQGITPDVPIDADWLDTTQAEDPYLLAALEVLEADAGPSEAPAPSLAPPAAGSPGASPGGSTAPGSSLEPDASPQPSASASPRPSPGASAPPSGPAASAAA